MQILPTMETVITRRFASQVPTFKVGDQVRIEIPLRRSRGEICYGKGSVTKVDGNDVYVVIPDVTGDHTFMSFDKNDVYHLDEEKNPKEMITVSSVKDGLFVVRLSTGIEIFDVSAPYKSLIYLPMSMKIKFEILNREWIFTYVRNPFNSGAFVEVKTGKKIELTPTKTAKEVKVDRRCMSVFLKDILYIYTRNYIAAFNMRGKEVWSSNITQQDMYSNDSFFSVGDYAYLTIDNTLYRVPHYYERDAKLSVVPLPRPTRPVFSTKKAELTAEKAKNKIVNPDGHALITLSYGDDDVVENIFCLQDILTLGPSLVKKFTQENFSSFINVCAERVEAWIEEKSRTYPCLEFEFKRGEFVKMMSELPIQQILENEYVMTQKETITQKGERIISVKGVILNGDKTFGGLCTSSVIDNVSNICEDGYPFSSDSFAYDMFPSKHCLIGGKLNETDVRHYKALHYIFMFLMDRAAYLTMKHSEGLKLCHTEFYVFDGETFNLRDFPQETIFTDFDGIPKIYDYGKDITYAYDGTRLPSFGLESAHISSRDQVEPTATIEVSSMTYYEAVQDVSLIGPTLSEHKMHSKQDGLVKTLDSFHKQSFTGDQRVLSLRIKTDGLERVVKLAYAPYQGLQTMRYTWLTDRMLIVWDANYYRIVMW